MPKRYRNRKIEIDTISYGGYSENVAAATLYLDRETLEYSAEYAGCTYTPKDAADVKRQVEDAMRATNAVAWQQLLTVRWGSAKPSYMAGRQYGNFVYAREGRGAFSFRFERGLYAYFPDGKLRSCYWDCPPGNRIINARTWTVRWEGGPGATQRVEVENSYGRKELRTVDAPITMPRFTPPVRGLDYQSHVENTMYLPYSEDVWNGLTKLVEATTQLNDRLAALLSTPEGHARLAAAALPFALPAPTPTA